MQAVTSTQRQIIVISGNVSDNSRIALQLTQNLHTLELDDPKKATQFLGQEFDAVIFNTQSINAPDSNQQEQFDPNAFGAITGTIRGGGYLILLKPEKWSQDSLFLTRFERVLGQYPNIRFIDSNTIEANALTSVEPSGSEEPLAPLKPRQTQASEDQQQTVKAIIRVVKGHRRRPLVITADRGRGKSAALGIAAAQLYQQGCKNIIICAPSRKTAAVVFQYADNTPLQFYSPDELQQKRPQADLLLIDEAAAIPVPLLIDFAKHYSRLVFATTQHGYEGSGRGFALSFKKSLNKVTPEWKSCELISPIRWHTGDLLEQFVYQALLLNAEAVDAEIIKTAKYENCQFKQIDKKQLLQNESLLKEIFGLLVSAHYQTRPSDFKQMLDDANICIFTLQHQQHSVAVSLVAKEGGIAIDLAEKIFAGTRRIKGHLVAQALAANIGLAEAACLHGQRILRIAVHPNLQQQGLGTYLLKRLSSYFANHSNKETPLDYLSTSFGASTPLLHFWQKSGFTPVYLSMKRDASSGTHSVIMLNAQSQSGKQMQSSAREYFSQSFPYLLSDPFRYLETDIAFELLQTSDQALQQTSDKTVLTENDKKIIRAFAKAQRGYENSLYPIWKLVLTKFPLSTKVELSNDEKALIILKVLQKHSWKTCCFKLKKTANSRKNILLMLRKCSAKLLNSIEK